MMKKMIPSLGLFTMLAAIASCSGNKSNNTVKAADSVAATQINVAMAYEVDSAQSVMTWKGFKPGGERFGKLPISSGKVSITDGLLLGGHVEIKMDGIVVDDLEGEMANKLKEHLQNEDFFDVERYPVARFELTDIPEAGLPLGTLAELKGNLTLKDVTKNVTIPIDLVNFNASDSSWSIRSKVFRINRADWNVKYASKSFFSNLGDKFIDDEMELSFWLKTR
ncbi:YceI family protein [Porphyromonas sp. COT-290 OH3588]|uniref:YceI family protein n=1 Tax=Porphyromonas sp. COT-290 OH3588 TaxID=1515617 RepID=UPI000AB6223E|nr:YceI family protein [Porphyromonas sp. COT-290 OH3588]